jgi:hypothetical protein
MLAIHTSRCGRFRRFTYHLPTQEMDSIQHLHLAKSGRLQGEQRCETEEFYYCAGEVEMEGCTLRKSSQKGCKDSEERLV